MVRNFILTIMIGLLFLSCGPQQFSPHKISDVNFEKTDYYNVDLSSIIKPDKPIHIWVDENFKNTDPENAKYLLLTKNEYAKYVAQLRIKKTYKDIIQQQEIDINTKIDIINSLKEYVALERVKAQEYRSLWVDSENAYREEKYLHDLDNNINKGIFSVITIGTIAVCIIAL